MNTLAARLPPREAVALRIGLVTDLHYADTIRERTRNCPAALARLRRAVADFNAVHADLLVALGDLVDTAATLAQETAALRAVEAELAAFRGERHYVLGNHCVWTLTKPQFYAACAARPAPYGVDRAGWHFVVLDACFRADGTAYGAKNFSWDDAEVPAAQQRWLAADLAAAAGRPTIVFVHQRLDADPPYGVRSAAAVRALLEAHGAVRLVVQGHEHRGDRRVVGGVTYLTMVALVEDLDEAANAYACIDIHEDGRLAVTGAGREPDLAP